MAESPTVLSYAGNASSSDLTANGSVVTIGPLSVTQAGWDLTGSQAECTLGTGGTAGFTDTTYALTAAQVQAGSLMGA